MNPITRRGFLGRLVASLVGGAAAKSLPVPTVGPPAEPLPLTPLPPAPAAWVPDLWNESMWTMGTLSYMPRNRSCPPHIVIFHAPGDDD